MHHKILYCQISPKQHFQKSLKINWFFKNIPLKVTNSINTNCNSSRFLRGEYIEFYFLSYRIKVNALKFYIWSNTSYNIIHYPHMLSIFYFRILLHFLLERKKKLHLFVRQWTRTKLKKIKQDHLITLRTYIISVIYW